MKGLLKFILLVVVVFAIYGYLKPLPDGVGYEGELHLVSDTSVHFFADRTYVGENGERMYEHEIFDEILRMIKAADTYVLVDMFLFNDFLGKETTAQRDLSQELTDALIAKKELKPETIIQVVTDPINEIYGGYESPQLVALQSAGIPVVVTDLKNLRDSNPIYSGFWRLFFRWFGNNDREGLFPNPFDERLQKISARSYLHLLNYKANHRKLIVTDYQADPHFRVSTLVTSLNPHDGSSAHSNVALRVDAALWEEVIESERAVFEFGDEEFRPILRYVRDNISEERGGNTTVQLLTERAIKDKLLRMLRRLQGGSTLDIAMFYLADRDVIDEINKAGERGAIIRILLDPNKDAFGREKAGLPNRPVAHELKESGNDISIRWCNTQGEQCHSKMVIQKIDNQYELLLGSANLTKRNIGNFNLETNIYLNSRHEGAAIQDAQAFFNESWSNTASGTYSVPYAVYEDASFLKQVIYRTKELSGFSRW